MINHTSPSYLCELGGLPGIYSYPASGLLTVTKSEDTVKAKVLKPLPALTGACRNLRKFAVFKVQLNFSLCLCPAGPAPVWTAHLDLVSTLLGPCRRRWIHHTLPALVGQI